MYINAKELEPKFSSHRFFVERHFYVLTNCYLVHVDKLFSKRL